MRGDLSAHHKINEASIMRGDLSAHHNPSFTPVLTRLQMRIQGLQSMSFDAWPYPIHTYSVSFPSLINSDQTFPSESHLSACESIMLQVQLLAVVVSLPSEVQRTACNTDGVCGSSVPLVEVMGSGQKQISVLGA